MRASALRITLVVLALLCATCLVSLMALFMGGGQRGTDLKDLMLIQAASTPLAAVGFMFSLGGFLRGTTLREGFNRMWAAIPQWLVFIFLLLNTLTLAGEIALITVMRATEIEVPWQAHIPLACMFCCSLAYLGLFARQNSADGAPPALSGRWP